MEVAEAVKLGPTPWPVSTALFLEMLFSSS